VSVKFEAAYLRPGNFEPASKQSAAQVYARWLNVGAPPIDDFSAL
jgi:hypothetical protein